MAKHTAQAAPQTKYTPRCGTGTALMGPSNCPGACGWPLKLRDCLGADVQHQPHAAGYKQHRLVLWGPSPLPAGRAPAGTLLGREAGS